MNISNALLLAGWLATSGSPPATAYLEFTAAAGDHLALRLCFSSLEPRHLRYRLDVRTSSGAGTSRSQQSGKLTSGPNMQCPIDNRLGLAADAHMQATLSWSIDDQPQPPVERRYPAAQSTSAPSTEPPTQPQLDLLAVMTAAHS